MPFAASKGKSRKPMVASCEPEFYSKCLRKNAEDDCADQAVLNLPNIGWDRKGNE